MRVFLSSIPGMSVETNLPKKQCDNKTVDGILQAVPIGQAMLGITVCGTTMSKNTWAKLVPCEEKST